MKISIGPYEPASRDVPVTFVANGITHERRVNACHDESGAYDASATADRVDQVALGVAQKMALGVITNLPAEIPADATAQA